MTKENMQVLINTIGAVESGGQVYGKRRYDAYAAPYTNSSNEYTVTLGWAQNYGGNAKKLIQRIFDADPAAFRALDKAGIEGTLSKDWVVTKWAPTAAQKAVMMYCEIRHLGGKGPTDRIFGRLNGDYSLDAIMASLVRDQKDASSANQVGDKIYWSRHLKCRSFIDENAVDEAAPQEVKKVMYSRQKVVDLITSWLGYSEANGKYRQIIDIYNSYTGKLPRGIRMDYGWAWCAATWSALAVKLGYTAIMPIEISCYYIVERAKAMGAWVEKDGYVPSPGDAVLYDWADGSSYASYDNQDVPDHIGTVVSVNKAAGYFTVIEGNYSDAVKMRTVSINGRYIRGFITPKYDAEATPEKTAPAPTPAAAKKTVDTIAHEVIAGQWGNGSARVKALKAAGYDAETVQAAVNRILNGSAAQPKKAVQPQEQPVERKVTATCYAAKLNRDYAGTYRTTANLYLRNDAGTNKKALVVIPKDTECHCYGYYTPFNNVAWLYIQVVIDGVLYTGFSSSLYLKHV